ncbi:hypothetical protein C5L31_000961 [Secundilactobacillus malefermentans]|uniref:FeoB-type G domain-containing protein n=1 Tax=Secundilactobacillus malefermentans TaxID=176292 RepID=A0A4R5NHX3_9LACO|nr:ferrous iron transport protein b [Secundilactobacillus malefermentans DSM 5705 = KCTC 3548]TDG73714.1 hypothetical protein C5L31_000961 [Secundilactobacillus malefermentans]
MTTVALLGNPNTGKTTLFNELTDKYAYVGNWEGVTVEKKLGNIRHSEVVVVDLPGIYSLNPMTKDETVVTDYLLSNSADAILNVTNAKQLKRNLLLSIELLEFGKPVVLALNMIDDLDRSGISYDLEKLSSILGCHVTTTNARNKTGVAELKQTLVDTDTTKLPSSSLKLDYPDLVKTEIQLATQNLVVNFKLSESFAHWLTIQFMNKNKEVRKYVIKHHL